MQQPGSPHFTRIREARNYGLTGERSKLWKCDKRFVVVPAGRRSLKTELSKRKLVRSLKECLLNPKPWPKPRFFFAGPTRDQAKRIAWQDLKSMIPKEWLAVGPQETELCIRTWWGAELWVLGLDKPQRIEGTPWDGGVLDERADIKNGAWVANVRPALSDRNGWCWHVGVPDMEGPSNSEFKELFERGRSGKDSEWAAFSWPSSEVLPSDEVESARSSLPPNIFRQEYEASFESAPGKAYYEFVSSVHVRECEFDPHTPVYVSCDFNFGHHNWLMSQYRSSSEIPDSVKAGLKLQSSVYLALEQVYLADANVESMLRVLSEKLQPFNPKQVVFYGDYSGEQRKAEATKSAWRQIKDKFPSAQYEYKKQPPIADRLERANAALRNANGEIGTLVSPKCTNLIKDFEEVPRSMLYSESKTGILTHASDAFGYMVYEHQKDVRRGPIDMSALSKRFE